MNNNFPFFILFTICRNEQQSYSFCHEGNVHCLNVPSWIENVKPDLIIARRPPLHWSLGEERDALLRGEEPQSDWETHIISKILGKKSKRRSYTIIITCIFVHIVHFVHYIFCALNLKIF